jgi:hypothetical protein
MMRVYCGRFDPQVGVTLIGYDEPTRSDEDLWAADLTSPTNSVIECLLLEQSPNRLQLADSCNGRRRCQARRGQEFAVTGSTVGLVSFG